MPGLSIFSLNKIWPHALIQFSNAGKIQSMSQIHYSAPLTSFKKGSRLLLEFLRMESGDAQRLRDLGLREGVQVVILHNSDKMIVCVSECRIGLRKELARQVFARENVR